MDSSFLDSIFFYIIDFYVEIFEKREGFDLFNHYSFSLVDQVSSLAIKRALFSIWNFYHGRIYLLYVS